MYYRHIYDQKKLKKLYDLNSYRIGVWYHEKENYYTRGYLNGKEYRKYCNRKLRRHLNKDFDFIIQHNEYRKDTEFWWLLF